jgi:uncharacterized protein (TIGR02145 family)
MKGTPFGSSVLIACLIMLAGSCRKNGDAESENTVRDIDGHVYQTVQIGDQVWMAENLKTTRYADGTSIATGLDEVEWESTTSGAFGAHGADPVYGFFYNWYAASSGKICPAGWHIPGKLEWTRLAEYLEGRALAGGKLKDTSSLWSSPNTGATNISGFSALPAGFFFGRSTSNNGLQCGFWSSTLINDDFAYANSLSYFFSSLEEVAAKKNLGFNCRCVRD